MHICAASPFGSPGYMPGIGYVVRRCPKCDRRCWVGPKQLGMLDSANAVLRCMICAIKETGGAHPEVRTLNPQAGGSFDAAAFEASGSNIEDLG